MLFSETVKKQSVLSLRYIFCSGEALTVHQLQKCYDALPGLQVHNLYGPTEASIDVLYFPCEKKCEKIYIGKPISNTSIYVLNLDLIPIPVGAIGELFIGGIGLAKGYFNKHEN